MFANPASAVEIRTETARLARLIEDHPRFQDVVAGHFRALHFRRAMGEAIHPAFLKSFARELRSRIGYQLLLLDMLRDPGDPDDGPTFMKIMAAGSWLEGLTQRTLTTTLDRLIAFGFVRVEPGRSDRRLRLYRPTKRMYDYLSASLVSFASALDDVAETATHKRLLREDRSYLVRTFSAIGGAMIAGSHPALQFPTLYPIFDRDHGKAAVALLVEADREGNGPPSPPRIARSGNIPLAQVRAILRLAADSGLVTMDAEGRLADLSPLTAVYEHYIARELGFFMVTAPPGALTRWRTATDAPSVAARTLTRGGAADSIPRDPSRGAVPPSDGI